MARSMGGSRGGSRGGGRSMGGGSRSGSRSFSGGGRSRGSSFGSSGTRRMSGSGGYGGGYHSGHHHGHHHGHSHYHGTRHVHHYHGGYRRSSGGGCSTILAFLIIMFILFIASFNGLARNNGGSSNNQKLNRDKYHGSVDSSQGYYEDTCVEKFIDRSNEQTLISGFKEFYNKTGVFPFLYVREYTPDKSEYKGYDTYQDMLYEELFDSEGNFLIVYIAQEDDYYFAAGYDTGEIIDEQSLNVICDKVNGYWYTGDLAKAFGDGLEDASKNIMAKSNARAILTVLIIVVGAIAVVAILYKWWKSKKEQENKEQEALENILDKPLETFGNDMNDLKAKYDQQ